MNDHPHEPPPTSSADAHSSRQSSGSKIASLLGRHKLSAGFLGALVTATLGVIVPQLIHSAESVATSQPAPLSVQVLTDLSRFRSSAPHVPEFVIPRPISSIGPPPNRYAAQPGFPHIAADSDGLDGARYDWAHSLGGFDANETLLRLSISGTSAAATDLQQLRAKIIRCTSRRKGTLVSYLGQGDSIGTRFFTITLDGAGIINGYRTLPATVQYVGTSANRHAGPEPFPLRVTDSIQEEFDITADVLSHDGQWELLLDWTQQSRSGTTVITDHGSPLDTTAAGDGSIPGVDGVSWDPKAQRWVPFPPS